MLGSVGESLSLGAEHSITVYLVVRNKKKDIKVYKDTSDC